jgi:hypothetical protein
MEELTMILFQVCQCSLHKLRLDTFVLGRLLQQLYAGLKPLAAGRLVGSYRLHLSCCEQTAACACQ